jgi:hypothetical protein
MRTTWAFILMVLVIQLSSCKQEVCDDTCYWPNDGVCDDGGENAQNDYCQFGTDCTDCGVRYE